ncbi:hypothetical protein Nepgr_008481 [Nepenthes gracilis]|uniref:Reverse transcriptase domain-containing protein n=1 Tax=Nepenthes gracilis TaxID=150966 RepID=A0AAD3S955_NEPGR|nr:hypothetical protein Nepgr_008481 [Nepenthes gracilis]
MVVLRLHPLLHKLIGPEQARFIQARSSCDNILVALEVIHSLTRAEGKNAGIAYKIDMEKAFDKSRWSFVVDTLLSVGYPTDLIQLIMNCTSSPSFEVLWNGEVLDSFHSSCGL